MFETTRDTAARDAIAASWERCERQYKLLRDTARPIMRLQSSEITPRLERIVEHTGGRQGFFRQLATVAGQVGHCLVVTDAEGILVRLETGGARNRDRGLERDHLGVVLERAHCRNERRLDGHADRTGVHGSRERSLLFQIEGFRLHRCSHP